MPQKSMMPEPPKTAEEWTDLLLAWYEGHPATSQAFRDEIARVLVAYARQQMEGQAASIAGTMRRMIARGKVPDMPRDTHAQ